MFLHKAVASQDIEQVNKVLKVPYTNPNERDKILQTPLHAAATLGNIPIAQALIAKNSDINAIDNNNWAPIHCAVNGENLEMIELLLQQPKINTNILSKDGTSMLHYLVRQKFPGKEQKYLEILQLAVNKGADINLQGKHAESPLHQAIARKNITAANFLLEKKATVNSQNSIGETPLHYAVQAADEELVKLLLKYKADMSIVSKKSGSVLDNANDNIKRILTNLSGGDIETVVAPLQPPAPIRAPEIQPNETNDLFQTYLTHCKNIAILGSGVLPILCDKCQFLFSYPSRAIQIKCPKCFQAFQINSNAPPYSQISVYNSFVEFQKKNVISLPPKIPPPYKPKNSSNQLLA